MTTLNKVLLGACIVLLLLVLFLGREQVTPAGPRNVMTMTPGTPGLARCISVHPTAEDAGKRIHRPMPATGDSYNATDLCIDKARSYQCPKIDIYAPDTLVSNADDPLTLDDLGKITVGRVVLQERVFPRCRVGRQIDQITRLGLDHGVCEEPVKAGRNL